MASNFIPMVYAVLKDKGVDTKDMTPAQAVEKYNELIGKKNRVDMLHGAKISVPKAYGFNRVKTREHQRHMREMGFETNNKAYITAAETFFNSSVGHLYYSPDDQCFLRYDEKRRRVCVVDESGTIQTFFDYDTKNGFQKQILQWGLIQIS